EAFASFDEPNLVKIVWTIEAEAVEPRLTRLRTETRAQATDRAARRKFALYWIAFSVGVHFIRWNMLRAVKRAVEGAEGTEKRINKEEPRNGGRTEATSGRA